MFNPDVYIGGEQPQLGDIVVCVEPFATFLLPDREYEVSHMILGCICVMAFNMSPHRFRLVRRSTADRLAFLPFAYTTAEINAVMSHARVSHV